jgi:hypothetical protein
MELRMLSKLLSAGGLALALGLLTVPASAAPANNLAGMKDRSTSAVEDVAYRRCWWRDGRRHCRYVERYGYGPSIGVYIGDGRRGHRHRRHHRY